MVMDYLKSGILSDHLEDYIHPKCEYDLLLLLRYHIYSLQNIQKPPVQTYTG